MLPQAVRGSCRDSSVVADRQNHRGCAETKLHCMKFPGQRLMARDFDRQVAELQVRVAILNGHTALGIHVTKAVG